MVSPLIDDQPATGLTIISCDEVLRNEPAQTMFPLPMNRLPDSKELSASEVAGLLRELSRRSALAGGNPYRAGAYAKAAEVLATLAAPLKDILGTGRLRDIPGVGETI